MSVQVHLAKMVVHALTWRILMRAIVRTDIFGHLIVHFNRLIYHPKLFQQPVQVIS